MATKTKKPLKERSGEFKVKVKDYKAALNEAVNVGYRLGWEAHSKLSDVRGARMASRYGFAKGLREHKRADKYNARAKSSAARKVQRT